MQNPGHLCQDRRSELKRVYLRDVQTAETSRYLKLHIVSYSIASSMCMPNVLVYIRHGIQLYNYNVIMCKYVRACTMEKKSHFKAIDSEY